MTAASEVPYGRSRTFAIPRCRRPPSRSPVSTSQQRIAHGETLSVCGDSVDVLTAVALRAQLDELAIRQLRHVESSQIAGDRPGGTRVEAQLTDLLTRELRA